MNTRKLSCVISVLTCLGENVPGSCIRTQMTKLRKRANELGFTAQPTIVSAPVNHSKTISRPAMAKKSVSRSGDTIKVSKKRKRGGILTSDSDG